MFLSGIHMGGTRQDALYRFRHLSEAVDSRLHTRHLVARSRTTWAALTWLRPGNIQHRITRSGDDSALASYRT